MRPTCISWLMCAGAAAGFLGVPSWADEAIYWTEHSSSHGRIQRMDLTTGEVQTIRFVEGEYPTGLAVDLEAGFLFWGDQLRFGIFRSRLDGSDVRQLTFSNSPRALDIDAASRLLFWSDGGGGAISSMSYEGAQSHAIIDALIPNGVAYDSGTQHVYWSDLSRRWIGRANPDGSNPTVLVSNLNAPGRLRVDPWRDRLIWTNGVGDFEEYALASGQLSTISLGAGFVRPFDISDEQFFWLDTLNGGVYRSSLDGSESVLLYDERFYSQTDVRWVPEPGSLMLVLVAAFALGSPVRR
ncbi:MAG: hypothetical protein IPM64_10940 [Phycisphaerales bacterium]|nr:hypothetical protein [Phycisphaerales bacterium]